jgi:hypothetical protein
MLLKFYVNSAFSVQNFPLVTGFGIATLQESSLKIIPFPKRKVLKECN